ncbi:MAG: DUF4440 domain-containing protein [Candidatus Marinimicrobia bacterium]|jgi:endonuclease I|nr:DUF4440 domain-containing protein [Candidatus Neomarinimicrobiota bacterium]
MRHLLITIIAMASFTFADDVTDIKNFVERHWQLQNDKKWSEFVSTLHSDGTLNGDSNGSFWYHQDATVKAVTKDQDASDKYDFNPRYIEVDVLEKGKYAVAYYYLVGTYTIRGVTKSNYRTRVCQVLVKENGDWKVKSGDFTPLHSGSGIPD